MDEILDAFTLWEEEEQEEEERREKILPADEALFCSLDRFGKVDMAFIAKSCALSVEETLRELAGAVFQDPEPFLEGEEYREDAYWQVSSKYLSGNVRKKLALARQAEERFPGRFGENVARLQGILPPKVAIDEIHLSPGASWIPPEEMEDFACAFLKLKEPPRVSFFKDLLLYKIEAGEEAKSSVLNCMTYGVREGDKQILTALEILEQTMNAKTVKVYDYIPKRDWRGVEYEGVLNRNKTVEAQEKQKQIVDAFRDYAVSDPARALRFEEYYNDRLVGYTYQKYDGSFLKLRDLDPRVKLYPRQRDVIARDLLDADRNLLIAHGVGAGKTYILPVCVHERCRLGLSRKNLLVVPNNMLEATAAIHRRLYPEDRLLVIYPKDFTPVKRQKVLKTIRDGEYTAVYMAYSGFDKIGMSKKYYVNQMEEELRELTSAAYSAGSDRERRALEQKREALRRKLSAYELEESPDSGLCYDGLGITTLVVDEAHNYKNIPIQTRADGIVGMGGSSKKCREMLHKVHFTPHVIFATGTPLTNSLADLFTMQTYLQPDTLKYHGLHSFDTWVNTFGQRESFVECDVDANSRSLRTTTRFSSFHNLGELMSLFSQVCDFYALEEQKDFLPLYKGRQSITVPKNSVQRDYIKKLSERVEEIRAGRVDRGKDNLLKVTTDGRLAALDIRLAEEGLCPSATEQSKCRVCAGKVWELYGKYPDSVQIVFSDIGTPKPGFHIYGELAGELEALGIPREEIAFVHDATGEKAREKLFSDMNAGRVRVVIGSTPKLGVGVNVQERLVALHHLSVPWRPADMVQREGRILRKGNTSPEVFVFCYVTEGSFDAYSWQLLENKQRFISSFLSGTSGAREAEDIGDAVLSYAEIKALAIGNPLVKKRVELSNRLERTKIACRSRQRELQQLEGMMGTLPGTLARLKRYAALCREDDALYQKNKEALGSEERLAFGEELLIALGQNVGQPAQRFFDRYQGFSVMLPAGMKEGAPHVLLCSENGGSYYCELGAEGKTPLGCSRSLDWILEHLRERGEKLLQEQERREKQLEEAGAQFRRGNPMLEQVETLQKELEELDRLLEKKAKEEESA